MPGESATSPRRIEAAEKRTRALALRKGGATLDQIVAAGLYGDKGSASRAVKQALDELPNEEAAEMRALENQRLDALQAALWPAAMKGKWLAVDRVLRVMEQRAKLNGLNQPDQLVVSNTDTDFDAAYRELVESRAALDAANGGPPDLAELPAGAPADDADPDPAAE